MFISPHKFLGGPGSSGVLVFNQKLYRKDLPPSVSAGGTVDYVGPTSQDFIHDIEVREKAGTPGVLQILKAGLAFEIKDRIGVETIERRERTLLNDLFGIQSRAGCSCAGPYGHRLLNIGEQRSEQYRKWIRLGYSGIKPGWCRISLHYVMDEAEVNYIAEAVEFIADKGRVFLPLYDFDMVTGAWKHKQDCVFLEPFSLDAALECCGPANTALALDQRRQKYTGYLVEAADLAAQLDQNSSADELTLDKELEDLKFFSIPAVCVPST